MDTSKEYIKMSDCPEIQGSHKLEYGDVYFNRRREETLVRVATHFQIYALKYYIWLPRQDQLQEMYCSIPKDGKHQKEAPSYLACCNVLCEEIYEFSKKDCEMGLQSMEQLWLAFVMWEIHQKQWDGSEWRAK